MSSGSATQIVNRRATGVAVGIGVVVGDGVSVGAGAGVDVAATVGETGIGVADGAGTAHAVHTNATTPMSAAARITQRYTVLSL
jgi:hypothetical protein